jgi:hypothetical protein
MAHPDGGTAVKSIGAKAGRRPIYRRMKIFLMILLGVDMVAVVVVMLVGAIGLANVNRDPRTSNKLMRARVALQGVAIGLVVLLMLTSR